MNTNQCVWEKFQPKSTPTNCRVEILSIKAFLTVKSVAWADLQKCLSRDGHLQAETAITPSLFSFSRSMCITQHIASGFGQTLLFADTSAENGWWMRTSRASPVQSTWCGWATRTGRWAICSATAALANCSRRNLCPKWCPWTSTCQSCLTDTPSEYSASTFYKFNFLSSCGEKSFL